MAILSQFRGVSRCGWTVKVARAAHMGVHAWGAYRGSQAAWARYQQGDVVGALLELGQVGVSAYRFMEACLAAGTEVETTEGLKKVEAVREGDLLLARAEDDPDGPVLAKRVLEKTSGVSPVLNLHVRGQVIRTTPLHPYCEATKGWLPCMMLEAGDRIRSKAEGEWLEVEAVTFSGEVTKVYNFRVEDFHTYFVSGDGWDFSVWAHNGCFLIDKIKGGLRWLFRGAASLASSKEGQTTRARHHTGPEGLKGIQQDGAINTSRADPPVEEGVHVETEPFGTTTPGLGGPRAETGASREGAYVEIDLPSNAVPTKVGPRNTAVIPTSGPLPIAELHPEFVRVRRWWNLWYFWR